MNHTDKIMIVDDDPEAITLLSRILNDAQGREVMGVEDPFEAVRLFASTDFDLVLLDLRMPELDGMGVIRGFREARGEHGVPIIVITAADDQPTKNNVLRTGAIEFMTKPVDAEELKLRANGLMNLMARYKRKCWSYDLLADELGEEKAELNKAKHNAVKLLGNAIAFRDSETGEHNLRLATFAAILGKKLSLPEERLYLMEETAPLHDLGKVAVPDAILLKTGKLSPVERREMEKHPLTGASILSAGENELMKAARTIAVTHHEKWDGTGYPHGLKGREIPVEGRIVAVADVFDALISRRPYKEPWPWDESVGAIREGRGGHFDPEVVDAFMDSMDQVRQVLMNSRDGNVLKIDQ